MDDSVFDAHRVASIKLALSSELEKYLFRVAENYALTCEEAAEVALGTGLAALDSQWGRKIARALRKQGKG